jgi:uncharacterized protein (TIGR02145 family)
MYTRKYFSLLTICLILLSLNVFSQIVLQGVITDNGAEYLGNGAEPVANALVTLTDEADPSRVFSGTTNEQGEYSIQITQTGIADDPSGTPGNFRLLQNYPNPFNPSTIIGYELTSPAHITIEIYNVLGQKINTLIHEFQNTSGHVTWDGTNDMGQGVPAGLYIYSLKSGGKRVNRKMLLIDGHQGSGSASSSPSFSQKHADNTMLKNQLSDQYTLTVTGDNLATYEQQGLEITSNMIVDVTVTRTLLDIDGNVYKTVKIGDQWWMAENLKVTRYRNGDAIPHVTDNTAWVGLSSGAYCAYDNYYGNATTYGLLYNWYAVDDARNIAPEGWHVPTDEEWKELEMYLGLSQNEADSIGYRGTDEGSKLKSTSGWNNNGNGTNESGFTALPGGYRRYSNGTFGFVGDHGYWWSATEYSSAAAWSRILSYNLSEVYRYFNSKPDGFSVRCVRD